MKPRIYLAGYAKELEYRKYVKNKYGRFVNIFDPMTDIEENYNHDVNVRENFGIVDEEKYIISSNTDILVAYIRQKSVGTSMEILHAYNNSIPVFVIVEDEKLRSDLWLAYHTSQFFNTIDSCFKLIIENSN